MDLIPIAELGSWAWNKIKPQRRILVVEDNPSDALLLEESLKFLGKSCSVALTAEAAQALLARNHIWIAFIDLRLTYMDGWDLIPQIWENSPETFVVATYGDEDDLKKIPKSGEFYSMPKPVTVEKLQSLFHLLG